MTGVTFYKWLQKFNKTYSSKRRHVALLVDNCAGHGTVEGILYLHLSHVKVIFFPPSTTCLIQPLDVGIKAVLECRYLGLQVGRVLDLDDFRSENFYRVDIWQGIRWPAPEWMILPSALISNCWHHTLNSSVLLIADIEIEKNIDEVGKALTLEVVEAVPEQDNRTNISHLLCHPSECDNVDNIFENDLVDYVISSGDDHGDGSNVLELGNPSLQKIREQLCILASAKLISSEEDAPQVVANCLARLQKDLRREIESFCETKITAFF